MNWNAVDTDRRGILRGSIDDPDGSKKCVQRVDLVGDGIDHHVPGITAHLDRGHAVVGTVDDSHDRWVRILRARNINLVGYWVYGDRLRVLRYIEPSRDCILIRIEHRHEAGGITSINPASGPVRSHQPRASRNFDVNDVIRRSIDDTHVVAKRTMHNVYLVLRDVERY